MSQNAARGRSPLLSPRTLLPAALVLCAAAFTARPALAAPPVPAGAHPRIWLTPATVASMQAKTSTPTSAAASVVALCEDVVQNPSNYTSAIYQGQNWAYPGSSCALAYRITGNAAYATAGATLLTALLNDYDTIGDGAGGDTVVQHDTGYAIRFFAAHSAIIYDWLHDTLDAATLTLARERFKAWIDWYTASGYLNDVPGANYHAGYTFAKTVVSIAAAGEDDGSAATYWADVNDNLFAKQIVGVGLGAGGAIQGGDWAEGWEYGALSVVEYALSARALEENGASLAPMHAWASDVTTRFLYGITPAADGLYVGGDFDSTSPYLPPESLALIATLAGPGGDAQASWAQHVRATMPTGSADDCLVYDALAEARNAPDVDFASTQPPTMYFAPGTRNLYARSGWDAGATWAVFTSPPRLVPDHQHMDASNLVLSRGQDTLIVDPSPYGSRSTLTGNALSADSNVVQGDYKPSQTPWSTADMSWVRQGGSGIVAARSDYAAAFNFTGTPSDIGYAQRNYAYLPEGEVVTIDRVDTQDPTRGMYVRFRSTASLVTSGALTSGTVGGSDVAIHSVMLSGGTPAVNAIPAGGDCSTVASGTCTFARFAVSEYSVKVPGPVALAVHVIDALPHGQAPSAAVSLSDPSVDTTPAQNGGVVGAAIQRAGTTTYVMASAGQDGAMPATLSYGVPGTSSSRHVLFDAPGDAAGGSSVTASASNGRCVLRVTAGQGGLTPHPLMFTVSSAASGCAIADDQSSAPSPSSADAGAPMDGVDGGAGSATTDAGLAANGAGGTTSSGGGTASPGSGVAGGLMQGAAGQGCALAPGRATSSVSWEAALGALLGLALLVRRRHSSTTPPQRAPVAGSGRAPPHSRCSMSSLSRMRLRRKRPSPTP